MSDSTMRIGFGRYVVALPVSSITAQRGPTPSTQKRDYYRKITASLAGC
jgi:hypothetical protein